MIRKRYLRLGGLSGLWLAGAAMLSAAVFPNSEYAARRARLMDRISDGAAVILGAEPRVEYNEYFQNNDFMYLTGVEVPDAVLIVDGVSRESTLLFTCGEREARNQGIPLEVVRRPRSATGIENFRPREALSAALQNLAGSGKVIYTGFMPEELMRECSREKLRTLRRTMTMDEWDGRLTREQQFVRRIRERLPGTEVRDCSNMIWELRIIKSPAEIELLRRAGRIAVAAHIGMIRATHPGMKECELAAHYEYLCKREGARDLAYYPIVCSAENHPYLHYHRYDRVLREGDFLVIDAGPDLDYYDIDITVSYPVSGRFTARQKEILQACNAVHEACLEVYRPGLTLEQCRGEVRDILRRRGFDLENPLFQRMRGGFGHFVGMAVHDVGGSPEVLKPGMVFANEPLCVFPDENLGVRVEDTVLITEDGCENLTAGLPRTVKEIEALMNNPARAVTLKKRP